MAGRRRHRDASGMWPPIRRVRRRLSVTTGVTVDPARTPAGSEDAATSSDPVLEDVVITMGGPELDRLRQALHRLLGSAVDRPDTPARIEHALSLFLTYRAAPGRPHVLRRPATVSTPESWEIRLEDTDRATAATLRDAGRTGRFA
jgi:hypothetical protein